jgi:1A family penicillin-binding protein
MGKPSPYSRRWVAALRRWGVRGVALGLALLIVIVAGLWFSTALPAPERLRAQAGLGSTRILDRRGQLLYEVPDPFSARRRPLPLSEMPIALRQATIAVEDASFYSNTGVDLKGIVRAALIDLRSGSIIAGGSTITQQLARSFLLDPQLAGERTLDRKLREAIIALKLTATYPKDEILALYLNQTYYGGMAYGVESAAQHYFGKPVRDLDLAECALLAGLPQAPSRYEPLTNPDSALARQSEVLDAMVRAGFITADQAAVAHAEPLQFASGAEAMRAPHFVHYVIDQLDAQLGPDVVARGGLTITTTLDADLQDAAQSILQQQVALLSTPRAGSPDHRVRNGAVVVLDPADGAILTMVGSPNFADRASQGQVNAALARRQPGSAIKPLTYAAALERGWTPATTILDVPSVFPTREGRPYTPQNYDRAYHGPLSLREALATSSNVSAVRVLSAIGLPALLDMAERLGITSLGDAGSAGRYGLSLTLGGGEVTPLELTSAYAAFANGGQRVTPYAIVSISDEGRRTNDAQPSADRNNVSSFVLRSSSEARRAISPQIAYLISDILSDRYARMRTFGEASALDIDRPAAAKTGTTSDWRDNWTVGYTPDRVVGVWVGNANGQPMEAISGVSGAGPVWHLVMLAAHRGLPPHPFVRPVGIVEVPICAEGGLLPSADCPATRLERFIAGSQPTRPDTTHVRLTVDAVLGCRVPAGYPVARTTMRTFRLLPPDAEPWALAAGLPRVPQQFCSSPTNDERRTTESGSSPCHLVTLSPCQDAADGGTTDADPSACLRVSVSACQASAAHPAIVSPSHGAVFALSPGIPRERQQIEITARAGDAIGLTIYLDDAALATFAEPPYRVFWALAPGQHRVLVEGHDAQGHVWKSEEVAFLVTPQ